MFNATMIISRTRSQITSVTLSTCKPSSNAPGREERCSMELFSRRASFTSTKLKNSPIRPSDINGTEQTKTAISMLSKGTANRLVIMEYNGSWWK